MNETLELEEEGQHISATAKKGVIYEASDNLAMRAGKVKNVDQVRPRRLENTEPEQIRKVRNNV